LPLPTTLPTTLATGGGRSRSSTGPRERKTEPGEGWRGRSIILQNLHPQFDSGRRLRRPRIRSGSGLGAWRQLPPVKQGIDPDADDESGQYQAQQRTQHAQHEAADGDCISLQRATNARDSPARRPAQDDAGYAQAEKRRENQPAQRDKAARKRRDGGGVGSGLGRRRGCSSGPIIGLPRAKKA